MKKYSIKIKCRNCLKDKQERWFPKFWKIECKKCIRQKIKVLIEILKEKNVQKTKMENR